MALSGPADNTGHCSFCGMALQVNGCTPQMCGISRSVMEATVRGLGHLAERLAEAAPKHPTPWLWFQTEERLPVGFGPPASVPVWVLKDASGAFIAIVPRPGAFDVAWLRELTALAPELEALVGKLCDSVNALSHDEMGDYRHGPATDVAGLVVAYARGMLARLDEARKG